MSLNRRQVLDYTMRYQIQTGRVNFANYVERRQLIQEGRLIGLQVFNPTHDWSIIPVLEEGRVNTTQAEYDSYIALVSGGGSGGGGGGGPTVPGPPTAATAVARDSAAEVYFTAPVDDGGSAILSYTVTSDPEGITAAGSSSPITVSSLTNGTSYTFTVVATNVIGNSIASDPTGAVVPQPATAPPAPFIYDLQIYSVGVLEASFTQGGDGGSSITNYEYTIDGGTTFTPFSPVQTASPILISYTFQIGVTYDIGLKAVNSIGTSDPSNLSSKQYYDPPGPPTGVSAIAGNRDATVSFTAPVYDGGTAINNYVVSSSPDGIIGDGPSSPITVSGLTNGIAYTFTVIAINDGNARSIPSAPSAPVTPQPSVPTRPISLTASFSSPGVAEYNIQQTFDGNLNITNYEVSVDGDAGTFFILNPPQFPPSPTPVIFPLLITYAFIERQLYSLSCKAINSLGSSLPALSIAFRYPGTPFTPTIDSLFPSDGRILIYYTPGATSYLNELYYTTATKVSDGTQIVFDPTTANPIEFTGLTNGELYTFTIYAENLLGTSPVSPSTAPIAPVPSVPLSPTLFDQQLIGGVIRLLGAPGFDGGYPITNYEISADGGSFVPYSPEVTSFPIIAVPQPTVGVEIKYIIRAVNTLGPGLSSNELSVLL
jgi:hypothetical protein